MDYLAKDQPGQLVFGGVDPAHYVGDFTFVDLVSATYWAVALDAVKLGDFLNVTATKVAIVDSGTSLLTGPHREVEAIATMMGATKIAGMYVVDCNATVPSLAFTLGGVDCVLDKDDLIVADAAGFCILGLDYMDSPQPLWILGDVLMRKYYVQFDWGKKRVGFALASAGGSQNATNLI